MKLFGENYDCLNNFVEIAKKGTKFPIKSVKVDLGSEFIRDKDGDITGERSAVEAVFVYSEDAEFQFIRNKGRNFEYYELTMADREYSKDDYGTIYLLKFLDKKSREWILKVGSDILPVCEGRIIDCRADINDLYDFIGAVKEAQSI